MIEPFATFDPEDARAYLGSFDGATRRKGEACFRQGLVSMVTATEDGFEVTVLGGEVNSVNLYSDPVDGWAGGCTCPQGCDCEHVYAAMKAVLAESNLAAVRGLSAGTATPGPKGRSPAGSREPRSAPTDFSREVASSLGRRLTKAEIGFLQKLNQVYTRCRVSQHIALWDFDELGLSLGGHGWDVPTIWPSFPQTEREFWLYLANAALERGRAIPDFMKPVTELSSVRERLAQWRRDLEVQRWTDLLRKATEAAGAHASKAGGGLELSVVLGPREAVLRWRRPGQAAFEAPKVSQYELFAEEYRAGMVQLTPEAERIWHAFEPRVFYGRGLQLRYDDAEAQAVLGRLFRAPGLEAWMLSADGQAFRRVVEPLRWEVVPAETEQADYRFRLVQADGQPLPPLLCCLPGDPALYVTQDTVYAGPPLLGRILDPACENLVPARAIETGPGLNLLRALGLELPPRIRDRVRQVPMLIAIRCTLQPIYPGSPSEDCVFQVHAEAADGSRQEAWNGHDWHEVTGRTGRRKPRQDPGVISIYDRSALGDIPRLLEPLGLRQAPYTGALSLRVTKKFPEVFVPWLKSVPPHVTVYLAGDLETLARDAVSGRVHLDVSEVEIDWFDLRVVLDTSDTTLTPEELKLLLNAKGGFVRLKGKGWRRLEFDLSETEDEQLARLGLNPHHLTAEPQRLHALQLADHAARTFLPEAQHEQIQRRVQEIKARVTPVLPASITASLRPYQLDGFHFLAYLATNRFGGILADDMGLGKTLQALAWLVWLREEAVAALALAPQPQTAEVSDGGTPDPPAPAHLPGPLPSLVVCPKSVMDNWCAEASRFAPGLRVKAWSPSELNTLLDRRAEADLHVLNYSQLRLLGEGLAPVSWQAVILDEGQYIKNPDSQTAQVARALRAEHRLVLSGTPIENRLLDLWSLMAFAMPGVLSSRHHFARLYGAKEDPFARRRLAARVRPFLLRRTKGQVASDLPDRVEEDLYCEIEGEQQSLYRAELKRAQQLLLKVKTQKELAEFQFNFLASLLRLRQICCHPVLVKPDSKAESAKVNALVEQLESLMEEGHKVLVFSQFVELLELLKPVLADRGWPQFCLTGATENRGDLVRDFQASSGPAVFLISLKAGGFGLNLTAASYVVLFDPWWNPAVENQAIDRTHRIGQVNKVMAYRLLIKNSIEEKIRALQRQKKALAEDVLGEEKFSQTLTLDDLQYLFAD
jgi:hypothetical protein